jgi:3-phosphoshikimate 1-carboxyvinyltransferase
MKQRPVKDLVDALNSLGAKISFLEKDGFPPIKISKGIPKGGIVKISAAVSSQFISALMMIGPYMEKGLDLELTGEVVSEPYIEMTRKVMKHYGVETEYNNKHIRIRNQEYREAAITIEPDWSAASYWYEMAVLAESAEISIGDLHPESLQGDAVISSLCESFGIRTGPAADGLLITKTGNTLPSYFNYNFSGCPDLAQTMACICAGRGVLADLAGLQTLRIKEANRAEALQRELYNLGVRTDFCDFSKLKIYNTRLPKVSSRPLKTHQDHRMAMSLAPLALVLPYVEIEDPGVVEKSYPGFWNDLKSAGFEIAEQ